MSSHGHERVDNFLAEKQKDLGHSQKLCYCSFRKNCQNEVGFCPLERAVAPPGPPTLLLNNNELLRIKYDKISSVL